MSLRMLFWKNMKRRKAFSITVFLLMSMVSFILISASATYYNVNNHIDEALQANNAPDYMTWVSGSAEQIDQAWLHDLTSHETVDHVEQQPLISVNSSSVFIQGAALDNSLFLKAYEPNVHPVQLARGEQDTLPEPGAIYLPYIFQESYHCEIGDQVTIKLSDQEKQYTIQDFYEDPVNGNAMFGLKFLIVSQQELAELSRLQDHTTIMEYTQINTYLKPTSDPAQAAFTLNEDVSLEYNADFAYALSFFEDGTRLIPSLMLLVIMGFSVLIFLITLLVLSYALKAAISEDTLEIGVMKAVGFSEQQIARLPLMQYGCVALMGLLMGALLSIAAITSLEEMVLSSSGLFVSGSPRPFLMVLIGCLLMLCICGMIKRNTSQIRKISCVRALSAKQDDVYFSSLLNVPLQQLTILPLTVRLAIKHIVTHIKQYTMIMLISLLLSECLLTIMTVNSYFQKDGMASITGGLDADVYINYNTEEDRDKLPEVINKIKEDEQIKLSYMSGGEHYKVDHMQMYIVYANTFDEAFAAPPLQGRFPKYDNEIVITEMVLELLQKQVGDRVTVTSSDGLQQEYLIVGAHQTFNEMGKQCLMTTDGVHRFNTSAIGYRYNIQFEERGQRADLVKRINEDLSKQHTTLRIVDEYENIKQYAEAEQVAILAITLLIIVLSIILIGMITFLLAKITIEKEKTDLAILKFQGFTTKQLQHQFAFRYTIIALLGSLLGVLLNICTNSALMPMLLKNFGVTRFISHYSIAYVLAPILLILVLTYLSSMITTRKIKRINVQALTNDN